MAVKNGKPATGFNAQNRKWVREVVQSEAIAVEALSVTENNTYIAPAGKAYSPVVVNVPNPSTGKVNITSTAEVDVTNYATAQVVDANLVAENIKKDTTILGVTGSYEGGGSSDFSTAEVTITAPSNVVNLCVVYDTEEVSFVIAENNNTDVSVYIVPLYKGEGDITFIEPPENYTVSVTGSIEYFSQDGYFAVTGNGTITITASVP